MNFIDIASWQKGISLPTLFAENNLDGVIVKATEGEKYTNPEYSAWTQWLHDNGKPFGVYHFCDGLSAVAEAKHFYAVVKPYIGIAVPFADYEYPATNQGTQWLKTFLNTFYELSGIKCPVYCSLSVIQSQDFTAIANDGYQLWLAQYADMKPVNGFIDNPWQKGSVSPFPKYVMHQYTSCGQLKGWSGRLDFDLFYGSVTDWNAMAGADKPQPAPVVLKDADPQIVAAVLNGDYGIGNERVQKLTAAGYNADSVQKKINELYGIAANCKKYCAGQMGYLDSIVRLIRTV